LEFFNRTYQEHGRMATPKKFPAVFARAASNSSERETSRLAAATTGNSAKIFKPPTQTSSCCGPGRPALRLKSVRQAFTCWRSVQSWSPAALPRTGKSAKIFKPPTETLELLRAGMSCAPAEMCTSGFYLLAVGSEFVTGGATTTSMPRSRNKLTSSGEEPLSVTIASTQSSSHKGRTDLRPNFV